MTTTLANTVPKMLDRYDELVGDYKQVVGDLDQVNSDTNRAYEIYEDGLVALVHDLVATLKGGYASAEQIADSKLDLQPEGVTTLNLGSETIYNIPAEQAAIIRLAMIAAIEADRAQSTEETPAIVNGRPEPTMAQYARLGRVTAAYLGANDDYNGGDICMEIANFVEEGLNTEVEPFPSIGGQGPEEFKFWRVIADQLGIEHDGDEDGEDDENSDPEV